jgi:hypothetical protein
VRKAGRLQYLNIAAYKKQAYSLPIFPCRCLPLPHHLLSHGHRKCFLQRTFTLTVKAPRHHHLLIKSGLLLCVQRDLLLLLNNNQLLF